VLIIKGYEKSKEKGAAMSTAKLTVFQNSQNEKFEYYIYDLESGYPVLYMQEPFLYRFQKTYPISSSRIVSAGFLYCGLDMGHPLV
jgi:hypothetical protein